MLHIDRETGEVIYAVSRHEAYGAVLPEGNRQDCVHISLFRGGAHLRCGSERVRMQRIGANRA